MDWSNEIVLEFLEAYRSEPCIWDPQNIQYKNRNALSEAWERIRQSLSVNFTVQDLKRKKESLMATFRCLLKKKYSIKSGAGPDEVYTPGWFAYNLMESFLGPVYKYSTVVTEEESEIWEVTNSHSGQVIYQSDPIATISDTDKTVNQNRKRKKSDEPELKTAKRQMLEAIETIFKNIDQKKEEDDCELYARLLARRIRQIPERRRESLMLEIDGLVMKAKFESSLEEIPNSPASNSAAISITTSEDLEKHLSDYNNVKGEMISNPSSPYDTNEAE
ncbi:unnamed protein product [Acanthoscelides obtectus]|uniref:MADF domain-containing protein n=2 Tax=Acanthoscelides obtectus TaxID=200917 RepID=A0A9P0LNI8_ACAOB|nr:unnamed protein product [Acanthoscelides obtectus]CAK1648592.1 hypothetical protein AOBTE_LOCUS15774 [Acanthoscelides obtectus]